MLPFNLYTCEQVRKIDKAIIEESGIAGIHLMKRAGRAVLEALLAIWGNNRSLIILCGSGNNAGDGYILSALAAQKKIPSRVYYLKDPSALRGDAQKAYEYAIREGIVVQAFTLDEVDVIKEGNCNCVIVDAMLGIGAHGDIEGAYREAITWANNSGFPVLSIDIPSGLSGDTGAELGVSIAAHTTVTFLGCKQGLLTGRGPALAGNIVFDDLGCSEALALFERESSPYSKRIDTNLCRQSLPDREADAHKAQFGHVMVIGGDVGMGGAALMAAETAARSGCGMTSVVTQPDHVSAMLSRTPELMVTGVPSGQALEPLLEKPSVVVLGPGLGRSPWSEQMLQKSAASGVPMVVDADALNLIAEGRVLSESFRHDWILTPHPGEAARLLSTTTQAVQADRMSAAVELQDRYGGVVVLKGAGTLIVDSEKNIYLADVGNAGMAVAGMGDILAGLIGALLAQGLTAPEAAKLAVCVHGDAGDLAVEDVGVRGVFATDLIPYIRELLN